MHTNSRLAGIVLALVLFSAPALAAKDTVLEGFMGIEGRSAYVWRGQTHVDGIVLQPDLGVNAGGLTARTWGNIDVEHLGDMGDTGLFTEGDFDLSFDFFIEEVKFTLGYTEYIYNEDSEVAPPRQDTREVGAGAKIPVTDGLFADLKLFYDFGEYNDIYASFRLDYEFAMTADIDGEVGGSFGYAGEDMAAGDEGGFNDYNIDLSAVYSVDANLKFTGTVGYTDTLDDDVLPEQDVNFWLGFGVMQRF